MFKKAHYIALGIVVFVTLVLLNLPSRTAAQLKLAISGFFLPFFSAATATEQLAEDTVEALVPRRELIQELRKHRQEVEQLRIQLARLNEMAHENERLHRLLKLTPPPEWKLKPAKVIARDPANWWRNLRINLGLRDGISSNSPVLTPNGLVGRVSELGFTHAKVVLLGDPDCRVSVLVEGESRNHGIIAPASSNPLDTMIVDLNHLAQNSQIKPGQKVYTSGQGGIFPKGIPVGTIVSTRSVDFGLYGEARVRLAVNMNQLEEVWVMLP